MAMMKIHELFGKKSLGGIIRRKEVLLIIIDDYSGRVWFYILKFKHEAFGKFKEWKQLVENQTERMVKKLKTYNGLEFYNRKFEQLCTKSGIARHLTVVGTLEQNGLAERTDKSVEEYQVCWDIHSFLLSIRGGGVVEEEVRWRRRRCGGGGGWWRRSGGL
ncbi:retrovirus-related pol polyprotein from transposon TNT 1-94 [Tanacetum coccineum]